MDDGEAASTSQVDDGETAITSKVDDVMEKQQAPAKSMMGKQQTPDNELTLQKVSPIVLFFDNTTIINIFTYIHHSKLFLHRDFVN